MIHKPGPLETDTEGHVLHAKNAWAFERGARVALLNYTRANDAGHIAYMLWQLMQSEDILLSYFHEEFVARHGASRGDLACFLEHYLLAPDRYVYLVMDAEAPQCDLPSILGMIDFGVSLPQRHAKIGIWMRRGITTAAREAGELATCLAFCLFPIETIFGMSPHAYIVRFGLRCGWEALPAIPDYYAQAPLYLVRMTRTHCEKGLQDA